MSNRVRAFVEGWTNAFLADGGLAMGEAHCLEVMVNECVAEASFAGIAREDIEAEFGDLSALMRNLVSMPGASLGQNS